MEKRFFRQATYNKCIVCCIILIFDNKLIKLPEISWRNIGDTHLSANVMHKICVAFEGAYSCITIITRCGSKDTTCLHYAATLWAFFIRVLMKFLIFWINITESSSWEQKININYWKNFLWKKGRFDSSVYRAQDLSIAGRMLYHLSYGGSTQLFSQNLFTPHPATSIPWTNYYFFCLNHFTRLCHNSSKIGKNVIVKNVFYFEWNGLYMIAHLEGDALYLYVY